MPQYRALPSVYRTHAKPEKTEWARAMRKTPTASEARLWRELRDRNLSGRKFRRQAIILGWIVDFYCPAVRLAVEVDGDSHNERGHHDVRRDAALLDIGIRTLRIPAGLVMTNTLEARRLIVQAL